MRGIRQLKQGALKVPNAVSLLYRPGGKFSVLTFLCAFSAESEGGAGGGVVGWGFELGAAREGKSRLLGPWVKGSSISVKKVRS